MWCNIDLGSGFSAFFVVVVVVVFFCFFFVLLIIHCSEDRLLTWMEGLVKGFTSLSTVFQSYRDDGRVNIEGSVQ